MLPMQPIQRKERYASETKSSLGDALMANAGETWTANPSVAAYRSFELLTAGGTKLSHDAARQMVADAGLQGKLEISSVTTPTKEFTQILIDRKLDELKRLETLERAPDGVLTKTAMFGTSFLVSLADPVNIGASFVPVAGEFRWAQNAIRSSSALTRVGGRAAIGAVEGTVGAAALEPLIYASKRYEQAEYEMMDSFLNIAFGGVFGAGLHNVSGAIGDVYRGAKGIPQPWELPDQITPSDMVSHIKKLSPDIDERVAVDIASKVISEIKTKAGLADDGRGQKISYAQAAEIAKGGTVKTKGRLIDINDAITKALESDMSPAQRTANSLSHAEAEIVYRAAVAQLMEGRDVNVDALVAHMDQVMRDGTSVKELSSRDFSAKSEEIQTLMRQEIERLNYKVGMPEPAKLEAATHTRVKTMLEAQERIQKGEPLQPEHIEAMRQAKVAQAIEEGLPVPDRFMRGNEALTPIAARNRGRFTQKQIDAQRAQQIQEASARTPEPEKTEIIDVTKPETELQKLDAEVAEIEKSAKLMEERLGVKIEDDADVKMMKEKAERWATIAETAQLCVMRGG